MQTDKILPYIFNVDFWIKRIYMAKESNMDKPKSMCGETYSLPLQGGTSKSLGKVHGFGQGEKLRPVMQFTLKISQIPLVAV